MAIYIKKNNQLGQTTALMSNKNIKSIYVKQGNEDAVCVWGEGVGQIPFYYPASPECLSIYTVDKIKASTNERETLFTNPQEAGVVLVNPGDTLKIRFYSQWYQNPGSKIKQENQTEYVSKTNSSEEYSFVVQSGQGAVRLETMLGEEKSASCTITAPDKTWGRGIDSFAINVISRKGVASSHTINENKTISLNYGDQVNIADIVYPNEGYNKPIILLGNGFANNRVEGYALSISVKRHPKEYNVVKQFTGQNVAWTSPNMIGDKVYYDDEISFRVVRKAGYYPPTVNITNGSDGATMTSVPHSKDSSVINEINVSLVVKGAPVVTVQGGEEVAQTTVTLNVTMTEHINNSQISVYNAYHETDQRITVTSGSYEISGSSIVQIIKTSRVTGYKPSYTNNQKSPETGSMSLHISEIKGTPCIITCANAPTAWEGVTYEKIYIKGGEEYYRDNNEDILWGTTATAYYGELLLSSTVNHWANETRRPVLLEFRRSTGSFIASYYGCERKREAKIVFQDMTVIARLEERQLKSTATKKTSVLNVVDTEVIEYIDAVYYEATCEFVDRKSNSLGFSVSRRTNDATYEYKGKSALGITGTAVRMRCHVLYPNEKGYAQINVLLVSSTYVKGDATFTIKAYT